MKLFLSHKKRQSGHATRQPAELTRDLWQSLVNRGYIHYIIRKKNDQLKSYVAALSKKVDSE